MKIKEKLIAWWIAGALKKNGLRRKITLVVVKRKIDKYFRRFETMESKKIWQSKTFWFNLVSGLVGVVGVLQGNELINDPKVQAAFASVVSVGNIVLRLLTDKPIEGTK